MYLNTLHCTGTSVRVPDCIAPYMHIECIALYTYDDYCAAGMNRSGVLAIAYVMLSRSWPLLRAVTHCAAARGPIAWNSGFQRELVQFAREHELLESDEEWTLKHAELFRELEGRDGKPSEGDAFCADFDFE